MNVLGLKFRRATVSNDIVAVRVDSGGVGVVAVGVGVVAVLCIYKISE